ncbi:MAG: valine--tRNA ligase [Patescibacteria group bacterium]|nr:valine--tRNA ligase [Patescibacteria group bacterium]
MDKVYNHKNVEEKIYKQWEEKGYFSPEVNPNGAPYSIILPPPNANAPLHFGHAMYVLEDILIRFKRMQGHKALWLPGADHAGFETQFVFEKKLQAEGKSRFDYSRETLYEMIWDFVQKNRPVMENQLRRLGFSLDWSRKKFTLDEDVVKIVYKTFKKLYDDGLIYRAERLVNYCTFDGTSFSDLEVIYEERQNPLYYIKYGLLVLATTRPETKFGDTAVAVHPDDKRYQKYIGKELDIETVLGKAKIKVVADKMVDQEFGTGVVKITPAHDFDDFEVAKRHNLPMVQVIGLDGKMNEKAGKFAGLYVRQARKAVVEEMQKKGLIEKIDDKYTHRIGLCYKCKNPIEPLPLEQWFIKMEPLAKPAIEIVKSGKIKVYPKNMEKLYFQFLENIRDWNISRQIVWGIRIPAWKCNSCSEWTVTEGTVPKSCSKCSSENLVQDEDAFDTWFSSGQWPFATLRASRPGDYEEFYPTTVMETGYDILRFWVARMVMLGLYETKKIPFENIVLHGLVNDPLGKKMSKSKGNAINPLELLDTYGADVVRFALVYGTALGNDQALSLSKLQAMRNFTNKLWNMARFIEMNRVQKSSVRQAQDKNQNNSTIQQLSNLAINRNDRAMIEKTAELVKEVTRLLEKYDFNHAAQNLYDFAWHEFADVYIEDVKDRINEDSYFILKSLYQILLRLLNPFMPFVTEEIYDVLYSGEEDLIISEWPL